MSLKDKVALVSGASRGIGKAIAKELGRQGAIVIGTATTQEGAASISAYLQEEAIQGSGYVMNVTDLSSIEITLGAIAETFGHPAILVNNAAITRDNLLIRMKEEEWQQIINTNLTSIFRLCKAVVRPMMKNRWGRIINIGSVSSFMGNLGQTNYSATKAGLVGFSKSLAIEVASRNITVNVVAPGFIETDMTKDLPEEHLTYLQKMIALGRTGKPEEIAYAVAFLASPQASYITGETLHVNGGLYMN